MIPPPPPDAPVLAASLAAYLAAAAAAMGLELRREGKSPILSVYDGGGGGVRRGGEGVVSIIW